MAVVRPPGYWTGVQRYKELTGTDPDPNWTFDQLWAEVQERQMIEGRTTDVPVVTTPEGTTIPQGGRLVRIKNPRGSDDEWHYYVVYDWRGVELAYDIGDQARFREVFKTAEFFGSMETFTQDAFDQGGFVLAGNVDEVLGTDESIGSRIERELQALGLEDIPKWIADSVEARVLVAEATAGEWSEGRLWKELSTTSAFQSRWGAVLPRYQQEGMTIGESIRAIEADENAFRAALRPFLPADDPRLALHTSNEYLHGLLLEGWTPGAAAQVLEQAEVLRRDPESLGVANTILAASGLAQLDEVAFLNALAGFGPQDTIEALNTATAARAMTEAGIDLDDADLDLIMDLVDTSDRLLTAESWRALSQELSLQLIRFNTELDQEKLGIAREDLVAAAFGQESPTGKSSGEVLSMVARFERDRRAAGAGFDQMTGFLDQDGRLRVQGVAGL